MYYMYCRYFISVKLEEYYAALDAFESSLEMAKKQKDSLAEIAIKKAIEEVNQKIAKKERGEDDEEEEEDKGILFIP